MVDIHQFMKDGAPAKSHDKEKEARTSSWRSGKASRDGGWKRRDASPGTGWRGREQSPHPGRGDRQEGREASPANSNREGGWRTRDQSPRGGSSQGRRFSEERENRSGIDRGKVVKLPGGVGQASRHPQAVMERPGDRTRDARSPGGVNKLGETPRLSQGVQNC